MPVALSRFEVRVGPKRAIVGYAGHFLADSLTGDVVRLEVHGQHIPPQFSLSRLSYVLEYKRIRIGDAHALLPRRSEMLTLGVGRDVLNRATTDQYKTVTRIDSCRRFTADSKIYN